MSRPAPLTADELSAALDGLPGWSGDESGLRRTLRFATFGGAIAFMAACVPGIDQRDHHPVWSNTHSKLDITLNTFSAGGKVTRLDVDLARHMNALLDRRGDEFGHRPRSAPHGKG